MISHNGGTPIRLSASSLDRLDAGVAVPRYDRTALTCGIAHIGVGGFHRAHQALFTDAVLSAGAKDWAICGLGITERDHAMKAALQAQDFLYTVVARSAAREEARVVGSIIDFRVSGPDPMPVLDALTDPATRIVSMTVTEAGYFFLGDSGALDLDNPMIRADLAGPRSPRTVIGVLTEALRILRERRQSPPTLLSCDNLPHNGRRLRAMLSTFAREIDPSLAGFIESEVHLPCTMVDRITPATREVDKEHLRTQYGIDDRWPVFCEDYLQWVVEDDFGRGRPDWSIAGAQFVSDVVPYELMKIRLLNGSHSALSYLSYLLGHRDVDRAMADPLVSRFVRDYMAEIAPTVGAVPGIDLGSYQATLVERFSNPAISDQVTRLAMDGSRKIPNSIADPLQEITAKGLPLDHAAFAIGAWIRFLAGSDEAGVPIAVDDPYADKLKAAAAACREDARPFLSLKEVFPAAVANDPRFAGSVSRHLRDIRSLGIRKALSSL